MKTDYTTRFPAVMGVDSYSSREIQGRARINGQDTVGIFYPHGPYALTVGEPI